MKTASMASAPTTYGVVMGPVASLVAMVVGSITNKRHARIIAIVAPDIATATLAPVNHRTLERAIALFFRLNVPPEVNAALAFATAAAVNQQEASVQPRQIVAGACSVLLSTP
jgi:hypothetical protein